jgi:heat shock protein HtpX
MSSRLKTTMLLGLLTGLLVVIGNVFGGQQGMTIALVLAVAMNAFAYFFSDKLVLRAYGAQPIEEQQAPELYQIVRRLAQKAQVPMPRIYLIPSESPNAFATGRNPQHAVVAVTQGILRIMSWQELEGVLAHELGHVLNRDILVSSIAATIAGAIMYLAEMLRWSAFLGLGRGDDREDRNPIALLAVMLLAPFAAMLIQMAVSRAREYGADTTGARLCGSPEALASALEKLHAASTQIPLEASPQTAHLFIVNPLSGGQALMNLFSTHPPIEKRIERLRSMRLRGEV